MESMDQARAAADHALARRCAAGDVEAQRAFVRAHRDRVHVVLHRILGANRDMEDLAQDAFVAILRSLPSYRGESQLSTWIDRIATRTAYDYLRARHRAPARLAVVPEGVDRDDPERRAALREVARRLYGVLDRMKPNYRVAYALHVVDGRPLAEVARLTEASVVAVKARVFRAKRQVARAAARDPVLSEWLREERR